VHQKWTEWRVENALQTSDKSWKYGNEECGELNGGRRVSEPLMDAHPDAEDHHKLLPSDTEARTPHDLSEKATEKGHGRPRVTSSLLTIQQRRRLPAASLLATSDARRFS